MLSLNILISIIPYDGDKSSISLAQNNNYREILTNKLLNGSSLNLREFKTVSSRV